MRQSMKHSFTAFIFLILISSFVKAQDTIVLNNGKKILAKHIHIRQRIYYKDYPSSQKDSVEKSGVNYVIHKSGWKIPMNPSPWRIPITICPGIGISTIQYKFKDVFTDTGANIISFSPVYSLNIEYAPTQNFSFGIGIAWQSLKINPYESNSVIYYTTYSSGTYITGQSYYIPGNPKTYTAGGPDEQITESLTRLNIGARLIYHIRNDDVKDFYIGGRMGLSFWSDQSTPTGYNKEEGSAALLSIQAFIGIRREIINNLGVYLEGGIGTPYFANAGIYYKVNTKK